MECYNKMSELIWENMNLSRVFLIKPIQNVSALLVKVT